MGELEKLYEFWDVTVTRLLIDRTGTDGAISLEVTFSADQQLITLKFDRPDDIDSVSELLDIEHVVISKEKDSQREYGTIKLAFGNLGDGWHELWCDSVQEI